MTTAKSNEQASSQQKRPRQPAAKLYHPLAEVIQDQSQLQINGRKYQIILNYKDALDLDKLREKYDPFLDQYDYLVGDVASDHLRLKGFFDDRRRVRMDQRFQTMADYVTEYVNPGSPYFVLKSLSPAPAGPKHRTRRHHRRSRRAKQGKKQRSRRQKRSRRN